MKILISLLLFSSLLYFNIAQPLAQEIHNRYEDVFNELDHNELTLRFFNALDGEPIYNAKVAIIEIGEYLTDIDGKVLFPIPDDSNYEIIFSKTGFITSIFEIEIISGTLFFNRFSISPKMPLGSIRIVLDWDGSPKDLDAHFVKKDKYHISFRNMKASLDGETILDRDDTNGYGPETITINKIDGDAHYYYFICDYSNRNSKQSNDLSKSKACVKIYGGGDQLLEVYHIPLNQTGIYWNVFDILEDTIAINNSVGNKSCIDQN